MRVSFESPLRRDAALLLEIETRIPFSNYDTSDWFCTTAWDDDGELMGVLACEPKNWFDWHFSLAVPNPACISRRMLRTVFKALFSRAKRVTAMVDPTNDQAIKSALRLGFVYEGYCRLGIEGARDAYVFGMLEGDCPWITRGARPRSTVIRTDLGGHLGIFS